MTTFLFNNILIYCSMFLETFGSLEDSILYRYSREEICFHYICFFVCFCLKQLTLGLKMTFWNYKFLKLKKKKEWISKLRNPRMWV